MARQLSTSLSDLVLAISVFYVVSAWMAQSSKRYAALGMLVQGAAASAGVFRYSLERSEGTLIQKTHSALSWLAGVVGLALMSYNFCLIYHADVMQHVILIFPAVVLVTAAFQPKEQLDLTSQAVSGLSLLTILILCGINANWYGVTATLVYVLFAAVVGVEGVLFGIPRVDILHYALVVGNILYLKAL